MNNWHLCFQLILPLLFASESTAENDLYRFDLEKIDMKIINKSQGITVKWKKPDEDIDEGCYKYEVQYKNQCVKDWMSNEVPNRTFLHLPLNMKQNYDFRMRMKLECLDWDWSSWVRVQSWGNNKGACKVESSSNMWIYILITVLSVISFLLICLLMQKGIRKLILPVVPDPKHFKNKIMDIDQSQWWSRFGECSEECTTTEIEIVNQSENNEDDQTVVIQSMDTTPEQHDNTYCIYSSETPGEDTELQCSQMTVGYIAL